MLVIDPENKTCVEFQIVIKEKLEQGRSNRINLWVSALQNNLCGFILNVDNCKINVSN